MFVASWKDDRELELETASFGCDFPPSPGCCFWWMSENFRSLNPLNSFWWKRSWLVIFLNFFKKTNGVTDFFSRPYFNWVFCLFSEDLWTNSCLRMCHQENSFMTLEIQWSYSSSSCYLLNKNKANFKIINLFDKSSVWVKTHLNQYHVVQVGSEY